MKSILNTLKFASICTLLLVGKAHAQDAANSFTSSELAATVMVRPGIEDLGNETVGQVLYCLQTVGNIKNTVSVYNDSGDKVIKVANPNYYINFSLAFGGDSALVESIDTKDGSITDYTGMLQVFSIVLNACTQPFDNN